MSFVTLNLSSIAATVATMQMTIEQYVMLIISIVKGSKNNKRPATCNHRPYH